MPAENFRRLMEEDEEHYLRTHHKKIRSGVWGTLGFFRLIGDLVHMFLPQVMNIFVIAIGGRNDDFSGPGNAGAAVPPSEGPVPDPGKVSPSKPVDEEDDGRP